MTTALKSALVDVFLDAVIDLQLACCYLHASVGHLFIGKYHESQIRCCPPIMLSPLLLYSHACMCVKLKGALVSFICEEEWQNF